MISKVQRRIFTVVLCMIVIMAYMPYASKTMADGSALGYTISGLPSGYTGQIVTFTVDSETVTTATNGALVTATATPVAGYNVELFAKCGESDVAMTDGEFTMPAGNVTVTATYTAKTYNLSGASKLGEANFPSGGVTFTVGSNEATQANTDASVIATATPVAGYNVELSAKCGESDVAMTDGEFTMPAGNVTVTATYTAIKVTSITLDETEKTIVAGNNFTLATPTVAPDNALDKTVTWSTSDATVASVSDGGVVTGEKAGTATITATANDGSGKTATCIVTVLQDVAKIADTYYAALDAAVTAVATDGTVTLTKSMAAIDFSSKQFTLDLAGFELTGAATNAANVTIANNGTTKTTLKAAGTYKNDVSDFVGDGYDVKKTTVDNDTVFATSGEGVYTVTVSASTDTDRDTTNDSNTTSTTVDVFAGDKVTVTVKVTGARFVAADVTLDYDQTNFSVVDMPATGWDYDQTNGKFRFYNAKANGGYYEDGKVIGTFVFEALPGDAAVMDVPFQVANTDTYVAGAWSEGWSTSAANKLTSDYLKDDAANIRLKEMTASVTANSALSYKGDSTPQKLVKDSYVAKDNTTGKSITDATIKYTYLTQAEVDGTPLKDGSGNRLYYTTSEKTETSTTETQWPAYETGKEPKTPSSYSATNPTVTAAGDYVLYYQISKPGYVTVSDSVAVSVAKASVTLNWSAAELTTVTTGTKNGAGEDVTTDYMASYVKNKTYANPVATYTNLTSNSSANATVTLTEASNGTSSLTQTGTYTFNATLGDNYSITNPTVSVLIDGGKIAGYTLGNTDEGIDEWYDGKNHAVAKLTEADTKTEDVTIQYSLDGQTWTDEIPNVNEVGKYTLKMKLTADGYYDQIQNINFEIKNVDYKVEKSDWVTGYDMVLIYTNDTVPGFTYNSKNVYNISGFANKYKYNNTAYTYVYGLVIKGDADITKVVPSNTAALTIDYGSGSSTQSSQYDVNSSKNVDIRDLVAVQGTYNVDEKYLNNEQMSIVLRCDVNRDKKVDTMDCSQVKSNSNK